MKLVFSISLVLFSVVLLAQPNCEIYQNDANCYQACKTALRAIRYPQGSYTSQQYFTKSIERCPDFAYAYMQKAVPYLKRGQFIEWKHLIDRAVELAPLEYLGYRGWCRLQFLRDYQGAIDDIEQLKQLVNDDIGYCQTGDYHLNIALALCYKELGELDKARALFLQQIQAENYSAGVYDFYHLGVLEYQAGNYQQAIDYFLQQIDVSDYLGETYYFMARAQRQLGQLKSYTKNLQRAEDYYRKGKFRTDTYAEPVDKIYLLDILVEKS